MPDPEIEEEYSERMEVRLGRRIDLSTDNFRSHVFHRAPDLAAGLPVHTDVVIIADEDIAGHRVEHQVSCRDIPVTVTGEVKGTVTVGELVRDLTECGKVRDGLEVGPDFAELCILLCVYAVHEVPELAGAFCGDKVERPDKAFPPGAEGGSCPDEIQDGSPLFRGGLFRLVPFDCLVAPGPFYEIDLSLRPFPEFFYDFQLPAGQLCPDTLAE